MKGKATAGQEFDKVLRGMLAAGVHSGRLAEVLQESLAYEQLKAETGRRVKSVMAYPLVVLGVLLEVYFRSSMGTAWMIWQFTTTIAPSPRRRWRLDSWKLIPENNSKYQ